MASRHHTPLTPRRVGADRPPAVTADLHPGQPVEVISFPTLLPACRRQRRRPVSRSVIDSGTQGREGYQGILVWLDRGSGHPRPVIAIGLAHLRGQGHDRLLPGGSATSRLGSCDGGAADPEPHPSQPRQHANHMPTNMLASMWPLKGACPAAKHSRPAGGQLPAISPGPSSPAPAAAPTLAWSDEFQALFKGTGQALQRGLRGIASPALDPADVGLADPGPL